MASGTRRVSFDEAIEIARITRYPLPKNEAESQFIRRVESLSEADRQMLDALLDRILQRQATE